MKKTSIFWQGLCLMGAASLLAGCTAQPQPPQTEIQMSQALSDAPLRTIHITPAELKRTERRAYDRGFAAGRAYEQAHHTTVAAQTARPPAASEVHPPPNPQAPSQPSPSQPVAQTASPTQPTHTPAYSASGPARPLTP